MKVKVLAFPVVLAGVVLGVACSSTPAVSLVACSVDTDCASGDSCFGGFCEVDLGACTTSADCTGAAVCDTVAGQCVDTGVGGSIGSAGGGMGSAGGGMGSAGGGMGSAGGTMGSAGGGMGSAGGTMGSGMGGGTTTTSGGGS